MSVTPIFDAAALDALSGMHVQRAWFAAVEFPSGTRYLHTGLGPKTIDGITWQGVSDPYGGQLVALTGMEEPRFGQAVAVDVLFSGASKAFLKAIWDDRFDVEGATCTLSFATFDPETGEEIVPLTTLMPLKLTAPRFSFSGASIRAIGIRMVSVWEGLNFGTTDSNWSPAGQRQRFAGDKGLDHINSDIVEEYKA